MTWRATAIAAVLVLSACRGGGAEELLDTAQLEELQNNRSHARQLYDEIRRRYPESPEAETAAERLRVLGTLD